MVKSKEFLQPSDLPYTSVTSLLTNVYVEDEVRSSHMVGTLEEHVFD